MSTGRLVIDGLVAGFVDPILHGIDLRIGTGEVCAVVGPNGSGKSTLLRAIYGALRPSAGSAVLDGDDLARLPRAEAARRVGVVGQAAGGGFDFTAREMVLLGRTPHLGTFDRPGPADHAIAEDAMRRTGCAQFADRPLSTLSGGEAQRVLIARALAQQPILLLLDEPTNHLDPRHQLELLTLLRGSGPTVLVALHSLDLAAQYADQLAIMDSGRLVDAGPPHAVLTDATLRRVFGVSGGFVTDPVTGAPRLLLRPAE
ncbi:iron complex transport system ATP-binding protein [Naumannella cuiyingiana]|uniref:Iron complex transport system ATP-binding protein n=1 Tax=Naumannella cuiyingiana TaxID=1347891 RepID=A0A7Z0D7X0_9ACTN|nr:iron complex transport system ATP-binding protein [Naumannella cuiyingiana]